VSLDKCSWDQIVDHAEFRGLALLQLNVYRTMFLEIVQLRGVSWWMRPSFLPNSRINVIFCVAGFRPGNRATFVPAKVAKTSDAPSGLITAVGRKVGRARQLARLEQGSPAYESAHPEERAGRQASDLGRRPFQGTKWKSMELYISYDSK
jgi:hypothetical protein